ncbi:MAG TPA: hypothetical protein VI299_24210, partial [Polyangiales bacterium]
MKRWHAWMLLACSMGCDDDTKCEGACDDAVQDGGSPPSGTLLGANAASYTESNEATNSSAMSPEATSYTLETANGIAIHGSFEASNPTADRYRFNSGTLGEAGAPGFPGVDVLLVIDGDRTQHNTPLLLSLDTVAEKGYSALSGG